jgi:hypothetical protein
MTSYDPVVAKERQNLAATRARVQDVVSDPCATGADSIVAEEVLQRAADAVEAAKITAGLRAWNQAHGHPEPEAEAEI